MPKCDQCGKTFEPGCYPDGMPNGITFGFLDGREYTMCHDCIVKMTETWEKLGIDENWKGDD